MMRWGRGRSLRHSRLQLILAVAAIGVAVALPVVLVSVGGGVSSHELANLQNSGYQIIVSAAGVHGISNTHNYTHRILAIAGVTAASPVLSVDVEAFAPSGVATQVAAEGIIPGQFTPTLGPTESGLFPSPLPLGDPTDNVHFKNGTYAGPAVDDVLVSGTYATGAKVSVGQRIILSSTVSRTQGTSFLVTGTFGVAVPGLGQTGAAAVLLPLSDLQVLSGFAAGSVIPDAADTIEVAVTGSVASNPGALDQVMDEIHGLFDLYGVSSVSQEAQQLQAASGVLTGFYLALSSVGLTVGLMFLALILLRRVEADRRSIGIRRALGIPGRSIVVGILGDGALLAFLGAVAGVAGGYIMVEALATWASSVVQEAAQLAIFDPVFLGELVAGVVGLSLLASAVATRTALRIPISEALR